MQAIVLIEMFATYRSKRIDIEPSIHFRYALFSSEFGSSTLDIILTFHSSYERSHSSRILESIPLKMPRTGSNGSIRRVDDE